MTRFTLFLALALSAAFSAVVSIPTRAFCLGEDTSLIVEQDETDEETFVRSSPASSESEFRLEVDLSDLTGSGNTPDDEADSAIADRAESDSVSATEGSMESEGDAMPPAVADLEAAPASDAETLGEVALEEPSVISREEYLNEAENRLNQCL